MRTRSRRESGWCGVWMRCEARKRVVGRSENSKVRTGRLGHWERTKNVVVVVMRACASDCSGAACRRRVMLDVEGRDDRMAIAVVSHGGRAATNVGWREADRALRKIAARRGALDVEEAQWLLVAQRAEVHVHLGLSTFLD